MNVVLPESPMVFIKKDEKPKLAPKTKIDKNFNRDFFYQAHQPVKKTPNTDEKLARANFSTFTLLSSVILGILYLFTWRRNYVLKTKLNLIKKESPTPA